MNLSGKTALITGGGSGIGAACALALAGDGCRVAIAGRREGPLKETAARHEGEPAIVYHTADVADRDSVQTLYNWARKELGQIDILIANAGTNIARRSMAEITPEDWDRVMQINATGVFNTVRAVLPEMRERKDGLVVNISSIAGLRAMLPAGIPYAASKFAVSALSIALAQEAQEDGVRVTNLCPGEVETAILDNRPTPPTAEHRARILQPEDVADAVLMVAKLPPRAHVWELVIKPTTQTFV